jgi:uncharacterized protein (DUF1697 family)
MPGYALFLRGINVGGRNRVPMAGLRALIEAQGFGGVTTLLQSGNAVFTGAAKPAAALESRLEEAIARAMNVECACLVRTAGEWSRLVEENPFPAEAKRDAAHLLVVLLKAVPATGAAAALRSAIKGREQVACRGRQLYAVYPDGIGNSKLTLPLIEKHLGARGTGRNWNTVTRVAELLRGRDTRPGC